MKRKVYNILLISFIITSIGIVMDADPVEPSMLMRFVEFFAMIGIVFLLISSVYFTYTFVFKNLRKA